MAKDLVALSFVKSKETQHAFFHFQRDGTVFCYISENLRATSFGHSLVFVAKVLGIQQPVFIGKGS